MLVSFFRDATGARLELPPGWRDAPLCGVSTDSRHLRAGELFAAIAGPNFDGHDFIGAAIDKGCAALLVRHPPPGDTPVPVLVVPDVLEALAAAGRARRLAVAPLTVAVTGSSGKTTVKEMIAACLAQAFHPVHATRGNLNNHIGVPLTLLSMPEGCRALVVEMGMSAPGEIAHLARLAQPDFGVITNVQPAHMAAFPDLAAVAEAKGELFAHLPAGGVCLLPDYDPSREILRQNAGSRRVVPFGPGEGAMVRWDALPGETPGEIRGMIRWPDGVAVTVALGQYGPHMILNALAAASVAREAGVPPDGIREALSSFTPLTGRGLMQRSPRGLEVIDDTYNANPGSMRAALTALGARSVAGRRVAILGDMLELGETAEELHAQLAETVRQEKIALLITAGPLMRSLHAAASGLPEVTAVHNPDPAAWVGALQPLLRSGDTVLVKGSRGMRMERIVKDLMSHAV